MHKLIVFVFLLFASLAKAQTSNDPSSVTGSGLQHSQRLTVGLGHTHVSQGILDGKTRWLAMASWSLNYDYWLTDRWAIGVQNDLILETFKIEKENAVFIERKKPLAVVPVAIYKPSPKTGIIGGVGVELSHGHNLTLTRLGFEYGLHLPKHWEAGLAIVWDNKWNYYNSWGLALTLGKIFSKH